MTLFRRQTLALIGGGAILAAGGGAGAAAVDGAGALGGGRQHRDPRMLAPNPHNRQPWMVDLSEP